MSGHEPPMAKRSTGATPTVRYRFEELAIAGGPPKFQTPLHVGRPNIGNRDRLLNRIETILDSERLTNGGPFVDEFERSIRMVLGVEHAVAICNGTIALAIAMKSLDLEGEVILPSFTFIAAAHTAQWLGLTPVFCDVDPVTHNLDPGQIESLITDRTTAILPAHLWGRPCDIEAIGAIARRHGLRVLYDASHGFACSRNGTMLGNFGDIEVFSFHATKFVNSFEGGVAVTNDDELADRLRLMRNFGFSGLDTVVSSGINGKISEISAAMGLTSLESMTEFIDTNEKNYCAYRTCLRKIPGISVVAYDETERNNYQYVVLEADETAAGLTRDALVEVLRAEGVLARRYFYPGNHRMEPFASTMEGLDERLPNTIRLAGTVMCLPTGTAVSPEAVEVVCEIIRVAVANAAAVRGMLTDP